MFKLWLRCTGKKYLVPFLDGLTHVGRPATVFFPTELVGQGLGLVLSGLNTTLAFQSNPDWVWPWWYERQRDPTGKEFIPTGMNLITSNLVLRNWTSLGVPGSSLECMVDPAGMLTLEPYGWSVFPYVYHHGVLYAPPRMKSGVRQRLLEETLPAVVTEYSVLPWLGWTSETIALECEGEELVRYSHALENRSATPQEFVFGLALRPYNSLGMGHINRIKYKQGLWRINGRAALWILDEPHTVAVADRNSPDPIFQEERILGKTSRRSRSGIAAGICEYNLSMQPGEKISIETLGTLRFAKGQNIFRSHSHTEVLNATERMRSVWESRGQEGFQIEIPDRHLSEAFAAVRNRLFVFDDGHRFTPGTFFYHHLWIRDSAFLALAHADLGLSTLVYPKLARIMSLQNGEGFFRSQDGEWDSNGQAIFTLIHHVICSEDTKLLEKYWHQIRQGVRWIDHMRRNTRNGPSLHYGLMPAGFSAEHFGPNDHYYWDNFWSLAGIRDAAWAAEVVGKPEDRRYLRDLLDEFRDDLTTSMAAAVMRCGSGLPCSPYRRMDSAAIGNLVALDPLDLFETNESWLRPTVDALWKDNTQNGMFFQEIIHTGLNAYLTAQLARASLALGDARWEIALQAIMNHASPTWCWPEAIHPLTKGGCMGDGDHGWAAAEFLALVRATLVRVASAKLYLGSGVPKSWWIAGKRMAVKGAVTRYGTVDWSVEVREGEAELRWNIQRNRLQRKVPVYFMLPQRMGLQQPKISSFEDANRKLLLEKDNGCITFPVTNSKQGVLVYGSSVSS